MAIKTLKDFNFKNKTVLVRSDIDSDVINGKVIEGERIKAASKTIKELKKKNARVIVIAHQGRPGKRDFISLKQHCKILNKYTKIKFVNDICGTKAKKAIENLKNKEAMLLENLRFEKDEFKPEKDKKNKIVASLLNLIDIYVNDSFANSHRNHTSMVSFPKYKPSCLGIQMEKEVKALKKINLKETLFILGGAKPEDDIKLFKKNRKILVGGVFGQLCLIAKGHKFGDNNDKENKNFVKNYHKMIKKIKNKLKNVNVKAPIDYAVEINNKRAEKNLNEFPTEYIIYDIGSKTINLFAKDIKKAKSIYMKGPVGDASKKQFAKGTFRILKAISQSKAFSLIGGGHLSDAIRKSKIPKSKFSHISLSGGALLNYIAGEKLLGLKVLGYYE